MFTGIVERTAKVQRISDSGGARRLVIEIDRGEAVGPEGLPPWRAVELGESIAVNGGCLTVVEHAGEGPGATVAFDVVPETLSLTTLGRLRPGDRVNLERSLRAGDRLGGHYVTGHIDGVGRVRTRRPEGGQVLWEIAAPAELIAQILRKGSIAVDGISLTVIDVDRRSDWFSFATIPHTLERTVLSAREPGSAVNLETDAFGKWVRRSLDDIAGTGAPDERLRRLLDAGG